MAKTRAHDDYSVGWICALPKEQTAATAMLDEIHADLRKPPHDSNVYTLGSIGGHNVVIACLPKGKYGNNSATNVATLMIGTFPSIKIGLMVGIGGGVPPKVRLGDVVVSTPEGQYPGVVQWDFGKAKQGGEFERIGALNNPPNSLLSALTKLETKHKLMGSKVPEYIEEVAKKYPKAAKGYLRSDSLMDMQFKADYVHINKPSGLDGTQEEEEEEEETDKEESSDEEDSDEKEQDACRFCNKAKAKRRKSRPMRVHYGLIASGNQVIKDGVFRDKLNQDLGGNVLCIEMEAAGLMNNFPCLVIRGICDYADSHKNKVWQEHAAAAAAAFAKELLSYVQSSDVEGERPVATVLDEIKQDIHQMHQLVEERFVETKEDLSSLRNDSMTEKRDKVLNWLSPIDFALQYHDYLTKCEPGTGQGLLNSREVKDWLDRENQTLFCPGVPGAGKTFQMSILLNYLFNKFRDNREVSVAFLYHNYQEQDQRADYFLNNLIKQLAQNQNPLPAIVQELYDKHQPRNTRPLLEDLAETLASLMQSFSRVFILIDALDEYEDYRSQTKLLDQLFTIQKKTGLNLFATSRPIPRITKRFEFEGCLRREISPTQHDVFHFLDSRMSELPNFVADDTSLQNEIKTSIESSIEGMFLLAPLYIDSLIGKRSPAALRKALKSLRRPSAISSNGLSPLYEAYDKAMERIQRQRGDLPQDALLILSWVVNVRKQLTVEELKEAVAVEIGKPALDKDNIPTIDHIIQACAPLLTVDRERNIVRLVHYTTQEYFEQPNNIWMREAHIEIANVCMTYMTFPAFQRSYYSDYNHVFSMFTKEDALYGYAAKNWGYHTHMALAQGLEVSKAVDFLERSKEDSWYQSLIRRYAIEIYDCLEVRYSLPERLTALHVAACFGLYKVVVKLLEKGYDPNAEDSMLGTPLWWAARQGHSKVVELLLELDVNLETKNSIEAKNEHGKTLLGIAVELKREVGAQYLITYNADLEAKDSQGMTPLSCAARDGSQSMVKLLLASGADSKTQDNFGNTPLCHAVRNDRYEAGKLLIENFVGLKYQNDQGFTILYMVNLEGSRQIILLLPKSKAIDINAIDLDGRTPLAIAVQSRKRDAVIALLASEEVDVELADNFGRTPIWYAKTRKYTEIVQMLLKTRC